MSHPGNAAFASSSNPIERFGEQGLTTLTYPASHGMDRWDSTKSGGERAGQIVYLGKANAVVDFATLPATVQTEEMAAHVGTESDGPLTTGGMVCGSRGEVATDATQGSRYSFRHSNFNQGLDWAASQQAQKGSSWTTVSTTAPDQLRQRTASTCQIITPLLFL